MTTFHQSSHGRYPVFGPSDSFWYKLRKYTKISFFNHRSRCFRGVRCTAIVYLCFWISSLLWSRQFPHHQSDHALPFNPASRPLSRSSGSFTCASPTRKHVSVCRTVWRVRPANVLGHFEQGLYRRQDVSVIHRWERLYVSMSDNSWKQWK